MEGIILGKADNFLVLSFFRDKGKSYNPDLHEEVLKRTL